LLPRSSSLHPWHRGSMRLAAIGAACPINKQACKQVSCRQADLLLILWIVDVGLRKGGSVLRLEQWGCWTKATHVVGGIVRRVVRGVVCRVVCRAHSGIPYELSCQFDKTGCTAPQIQAVPSCLTELAKPDVAGFPPQPPREQTLAFPPPPC